MILTSNNLVAGNLIDSNPTGTGVIGQTENGIVFSGSANTVGGTVAAARNILPTDGIWLQGEASGNLVEGNILGLDITGTIKLAQYGIGIEADGPNNTIGGTVAGSANILAGSGSDALSLVGTTSTGNLIEGNLVGTDITGTISIRNAGSALSITGGTTNNTIGGTTPGAGNVLSSSNYGLSIDSSSYGNLVEGNLIGTDITGTQSLYDSMGVNIVGADNTIGGTAAGAGNLIAGFVNPGGGDENVSTGIWLEGSGATGNLIAGNLIGTDVTGEHIVDSSTHAGIFVDDAPNNTIGGVASDAVNVIAGFGYGLFITGSDATGNLVEGNLIGTDKTGTVALANETGGIILDASAQSNTIGGTSAGAGNVISGNQGAGLDIGDASDNLFLGNLIGTSGAGSAALANDGPGITLWGGSDNNTVGGTATGAGNVISGNTDDGVEISGSGTTGNLLAGNLIGTNAAGTAALANAIDGAEIDTGATGNTIGGIAASARNLISGNTTAGVEITDTGTSSNLVIGNYIGTNLSGTVALANGGDGVDDFASNNTIGGTAAGMATSSPETRPTASDSTPTTARADHRP